jgi:ankyrin repeat protein
MAAESGHEKVVQLLLDKGADVNIKYVKNSLFFLIYSVYFVVYFFFLLL